MVSPGRGTPALSSATIPKMIHGPWTGIKLIKASVKKVNSPYRFYSPSGWHDQVPKPSREPPGHRSRKDYHAKGQAVDHEWPTGKSFQRPHQRPSPKASSNGSTGQPDVK